ncbi:MAG: histidine kinase [Pseudomonadota bacterium]
MTLATLLADRNRLFWFLQLCGWGGYIAANSVSMFVGEKRNWFDLILLAGAMGLAMSVILRYVYRALWDKAPALRLIGSLTICFLLALIWRICINVLFVEWEYTDWKPQHWIEYSYAVLTSFWLLACWSALYYGIKYYQQYEDQMRKTLAATAAAHQAQLKMLRYQLNPHFLFNTLNAISTLILDRSNETANSTVTRLSDFLRYTLDNDPNSRVTLRKELESIDLYLDIEKVRFQDRLVLEREIESAALDALVPSLILQPLVENAIKYAIAPSEDGGTIRIGAKIHGATLSISVADNGPGMAVTGDRRMGSCGVGLRNIRERLQQLYEDNQALTLGANHPRGLIATINMPFEMQ